MWLRPPGWSGRFTRRTRPFRYGWRCFDNVDVPTGWNPLFGIGRLNVASAVSAPEIVLKNVYLPLVLR